MRDIMADEDVAWPSYVDFLSAFVFVLMLFLASTVYIVSGAIDEASKREHVAGLSDDLIRLGIQNVVEGTKLRIPLSNKVIFALNNATLNETAKQYLRVVGRQAADPRFRRVIVEGYADKIPVKGDEFGNWRLSVARSLAVLRFLYVCDGCTFDRQLLRSKLVLRGEGDLDAQVLTPGQRGTGRPEDRRVDVVLDTEFDSQDGQVR
jgi:flagellar motor protein MotB